MVNQVILKNTKKNYQAHLDSTSGKKNLFGYVIDLNDIDKKVRVMLWIDDSYSHEILCDTYKSHTEKKFNSANHGFKHEIPDNLKDGKEHTVKIFDADNPNALILKETIRISKSTTFTSSAKTIAISKEEKTEVSSNKMNINAKTVDTTTKSQPISPLKTENTNNIKGWISSKFEKDFSLKGWLISTENKESREALVNVGPYIFTIICNKKRISPKDFAEHVNNGFYVELSFGQIVALPQKFTLKFTDKATGKVLLCQEVQKNINVEDEYKLLKNECCKLKNENLTLSEKIDYTNKNITKLKQENEALRSNYSAELANYKKLFFDQGASFVRNEIEYKIGAKLIEVFEKSENTGFSSKTLSEIEQLHDYLNQSKNETLLSVIIPVFNTEKYVSQCLDSVLSQNIDNMEVICIDDGSTDSSLKVLEKYRDTDKRVKIIKQTNRSAGAARNIGLQNCNGKYVHFLDSDDWVCDNAYSNLIKMIKINDSDVVMFTYNKYDNVTMECTISTCFDNLPETMKYKEVSGKEHIEYLLKSAVMPWNKLYKKDFLLTNKIVFDEITIANDRTFYFNMLSKNPRIVIDNTPYINYRINNKDSLVGEARLRHFDCHFKCFSSMRDIYFNTKNYSVILDLFFKDLMYFYQKATLEQRKKIKKDITDYIENNREYFKDDIFNKEKSSYYFYNMLMNKKSIPIVFGVDKNYLPYLSVALVSLIHNSSNLYKYDIYILHTELDKKDIEIISKLERPNININFINVLKEIDSIALYSRAHYSISMYYRILIPKLFSQLEKVIYLDCDILVVAVVLGFFGKAKEILFFFSLSRYSELNHT